jgi:hypothetical protein
MKRRYSSYSFSTSALDGGEWSASRPCRALPPGKRPPVPTVQETGWTPEPVWTQRLEEKSFRLCLGSNLDHPLVQPVVRHYTGWATWLTHCLFRITINSEFLFSEIFRRPILVNTGLEDNGWVQSSSKYLPPSSHQLWDPSSFCNGFQGPFLRKLSGQSVEMSTRIWYRATRLLNLGNHFQGPLILIILLPRVTCTSVPFSFPRRQRLITVI